MITMSMNFRSRGEGRPSSEAAAGAMADASLEARWSVEGLSNGKDFVNSQGQHGITFSYDHPSQGGGGVLRRWWRRKGKLVQIVRK